MRVGDGDGGDDEGFRERLWERVEVRVSLIRDRNSNREKNQFKDIGGTLQRSDLDAEKGLLRGCREVVERVQGGC